MAVLPAGNRLRIDPRKLTYLLISGKAGSFTAHGFSQQRPSELEAALRARPIYNQIEGIFLTVHGIEFTVRCSQFSPDGRAERHDGA